MISKNKNKNIFVSLAILTLLCYQPILDSNSQTLKDTTPLRPIVPTECIKPAPKLEFDTLKQTYSKLSKLVDANKDNVNVATKQVATLTTQAKTIAKQTKILDSLTRLKDQKQLRHNRHLANKSNINTEDSAEMFIYDNEESKSRGTSTFWDKINIFKKRK